jgi:beta-glucosidase
MPNLENETKLTPTQWPGLPEDKPVYANYTEALLVGYRYYDQFQINFTTGFPFGHGLSYTRFEYSDLTVSADVITIIVKNAGRVSGSEVAQLYLGYPEQVGEPPKVLRGFNKTKLMLPGESVTVSFQLDAAATSVWDVETHGWVSVKGEFQVFVGSSSRDIRAASTLDL